MVVRKLKKFSKQTGIWKLTNLTTWDSRKKYCEESMVMVSRTHHQFSRKPSCQSFRARIQLHRPNQVPVKQEPLLSVCSSLSRLIHLRVPPTIAKHSLFHQPVNSQCKLPTSSTPSVSTKASRSTPALVELLSRKTSAFLSKVASTSLSAHQAVFKT